ncbi:DUF3667 domain-containing protein [Lacibacter luteus]|uniref:DUF3667 domain-containing protein n=1 Tax=Lacibacter luteus TaxID=2508719 RepID=A0A4Q1CDS6_9BACT|nr:DUF3667 domain-containing protein [Lacibacter luteus]RXK57502.1 DUF3667 domain-containing protein [Lacibacter luteus]
MHATNCLNCGTETEPSHQYCSACGQKTDTHRLTLGHIQHDLVHAVTHADKSIFSLVWQLLLRPGTVAREYVEGKRKKYFNPFAFLFIVVGLASVILISSGFTNFGANPRVPPNPVSAFFNKHVNLIIFLNVPLLAMFSSLFFRKGGRNFAENLVLAAYTSGERSVFFSLVIAPLWMLLHTQYYLMLTLYILSWFSYYAWASSRFHNGKKGVGFVKGFLVALCTQLVTVIIVSATYAIYFYFFYKRA